MSNKFDLERFKNGDPAFNTKDRARYYIGTHHDSIVVYLEDLCKYESFMLKYIEQKWTMKPKEEWVYLPKFFDRFNSKEECENAFGKPQPEFYEAVKIVRE